MKFLKIILSLTFCVLMSFSQSFSQEEYTQEASVYAIGRYGKKMANGDYLSSRHRTCSHDFLPMGTMIEVTNLANTHTELVEVNGKSQREGIELTHSVAHDLGLTGSNKATVKIFVVRRGEENPMPVATERPSKRVSYGSQTAVETIPVFVNPEPAPVVVEKKKESEFPKEFPKYEPMKFDSVTKKVFINGKPITVEKAKPVYKEKIIMN
jgi:rare lipoprotein A (peptidoglycan hydrolase)